MTNAKRRKQQGARHDGNAGTRASRASSDKPSPEDQDEIKHGKWDRWAKKHTFVRALEGTYSHLYKKLLEEPRVYSSKDHPWKG